MTVVPDLNRKYTDYINSDAWQKFRARVKKARKNRCERCGADGNKVILQVHHLTYERLGHERLKDVELLCVRPCHEEADKERRNNTYKGTKFYQRKKK
jgi:hypothetical protein